jgi:hypothetical protein
MGHHPSQLFGQEIRNWRERKTYFQFLPLSPMPVLLSRFIKNARGGFEQIWGKTTLFFPQIYLAAASHKESMSDLLA